MVESGRRPSRFRVASRTVLRELERYVVWAGRCVEVGVVAVEAGVRRVVVVPVVASGALVCNHCVSAIQWIKIIVQREGRRLPIGGRRVAEGAVVGQVQRYVVRIGGGIKIGGMAARTVGRRGCVVAVDVALRTFICYRNMLAGERPDGIVVKS